jgi:nucleoid-associated protein YgaU
MQRIEKYGVIALVFLLVTILAVSLWGESKGDGFFSMFKSSPKKGAAANVERPLRNRLNAQPVGEQTPGDRMLPLTTAEAPATQPGAQAMPTPTTLAQQQPGAPTQMVSQPPAQPGGVIADPLAALRGTGATPAANNVAPTNGAFNAPANANLGPAANTGSALVRSNPPAQPATREYKVKSGDTLGGIASKELGSSSRWVDIQRLNQMIEPSKLKVGMTLQLPVERAGLAGSSLAANNAPATPKSDDAKPSAPKATGRKYVVQRGDSLTSIAQAELGSSSRWTEIRDLNPGLDPARISVGATLAMPAGGSVAKPSSSAKQVASAAPQASFKSKVK